MWAFGFLLPNLKMGKPFEAPEVALVGPDDQRVSDICAAVPAISTMMASFTDTFGEAYRPSALIVDVPDPEKPMLETMLNTRNTLAICTLLKAWAKKLFRKSRSAGCYLYSDYFDFYPIIPGPNGRLTPKTPIVLGIDDPEQLRGQCSITVVYPANEPCDWDARLANLLVKVQGATTDSERERHVAHGVFRSLQIAYQAARSPSENWMSVYDYGTRLVIWVSAIEVLLHAGKAHVTQGDVRKFLAGCPWKNEYLIDNDIPGKLCDGIYRLRNDFVHGNDILEDRGRAFPKQGKESVHLLHVVPLLYWMALRHTIETQWPRFVEGDEPIDKRGLRDSCIQALYRVASGQIRGRAT